jgi:hypothetical protein
LDKILGPFDSRKRSYQGLYDRWRKTILPACSKFVGCYNAASIGASTGNLSEEAIIVAAQTLYRNQEGKHFNFLQCWNEIKHLPKFCAPSAQSAPSAPSNSTVIIGGKEEEDMLDPIPNTYDSGAVVGPTTSRDKAKRAITLAKERDEKKRTGERMIEVLQANGRHLSSLSSFITTSTATSSVGIQGQSYPGIQGQPYPGIQGQTYPSNPSIDISAFQVTINMLMASGQEVLAKQMLGTLSAYQMGQISSIMGSHVDTGKTSREIAGKHDQSLKNSTVLEINDSDREFTGRETSSHFNADKESINSLDEIYAKAKKASEYDSDSLYSL